MDTKSVLYILLVALVGLALIFVVSIFDSEEVPVADEIRNEEEPETPAQQTLIFDDWTTTIHGNTFNYEIVDTVDMEGAPAGDHPYYHVWDEEEQVCNTQFTEGFVENSNSEDLLRAVGFGVAYCGAIADLSSDWINDPWGGFEDLPSYTAAWFDLYVSRCGESLSPLGWEPADDGECEVPGLREVEA